jgi:hypothetical protein
VTTVTSGVGAGSTIRTWDDGGLRVEQRVPPPGFHFAQATPEELAYYGVPHSLSPAGLANLTAPPIGSIAPRPDLPSAGTINSPNWTGILVGNPSAYGSAATWTEPTPVWNECSAPEYAYYWTGLGGTGTNGLVQNGTMQFNSGGEYGDGFLWWELYPYELSPQLLTNSSGTPIAYGDGNYVGSIAAYDAADSTGSTWVFEYSWNDATTNQFYALDVFPPKSQFSWTPATSEFIVEHPAYTSTQLTDFQGLYADQTATEIGGTYAYDNALNPDIVQMINHASGYQAVSGEDGNGSLSYWAGCDY